jgi:hypothetical protein
MTKTTTKRFRVLLDKHENSEATGIQIPFDVPKVFGSRARVPVCGTINGFPFRSSVFPMGGCHFMPVNKEIRTGAQAKAGDRVTIIMQRDEAPRVITPPPDFVRALKANKDARAAWDKLSYTNRKEIVQAIEAAKKPETRQRRIEKGIAELTVKKKA